MQRKEADSLVSMAWRGKNTAAAKEKEKAKNSFQKKNMNEVEFIKFDLPDAAEEPKLFEHWFFCTAGFSDPEDWEIEDLSSRQEVRSDQSNSYQFDSFDVWLRDRALHQYADSLRAIGARRVADLAFLTEKDLSDLNISSEDRVYFHIELST